MLKQKNYFILVKVAANPFKNWAHFSQKTPGKAIRDDFFHSSPSTSSVRSASPATPSTSKRGGRQKRRDPCS